MPANTKLADALAYLQAQGVEAWELAAYAIAEEANENAKEDHDGDGEAYLEDMLENYCHDTGEGLYSLALDFYAKKGA